MWLNINLNARVFSIFAMTLFSLIFADASLVQDQDEKEKQNKAASMKETAIVYWLLTVLFAANLS